MSEQKSRHTVWLSPEAWEQVERRCRKDNCSTKNEYIERAIRRAVFFHAYARRGRRSCDLLPDLLFSLR